MLILSCGMRWIKYQLVTGCKAIFVSWVRLLCNIQRQILYWISGLAMFGVNRSAHYDNLIHPDNVQHNLMAILKILEAFEEDDYEVK